MKRLYGIKYDENRWKVVEINNDDYHTYDTIAQIFRSAKSPASPTLTSVRLVQCRVPFCKPAQSLQSAPQGISCAKTPPPAHLPYCRQSQSPRSHFQINIRTLVRSARKFPPHFSLRMDYLPNRYNIHISPAATPAKARAAPSRPQCLNQKSQPSYF